MGHFRWPANNLFNLLIAMRISLTVESCPVPRPRSLLRHRVFIFFDAIEKHMVTEEGHTEEGHPVASEVPIGRDPYCHSDYAVILLLPSKTTRKNPRIFFLN